MKKRWNFTTEIPVEIVAVVNVRGYDDPGVRTLRNGDPGYPPESEVEREITGIYLEEFQGWDTSHRKHPKRQMKRIDLPKDLVDQIADYIQKTINENTEIIENEPEEEIEERYDCPIHGLQDGPDCPRC